MQLNLPREQRKFRCLDEPKELWLLAMMTNARDHRWLAAKIVHFEDVAQLSRRRYRKNERLSAGCERSGRGGVKYRRIEGRFARGIPNKNSSKATRSKFEIDK